MLVVCLETAPEEAGRSCARLPAPGEGVRFLGPVAEAHAENGLPVDEVAADAWINSIGIGQEPPQPQPRPLIRRRCAARTAPRVKAWNIARWNRSPMGGMAWLFGYSASPGTNAFILDQHREPT